MPVFTKRIENATSFIRITKPLGYYATSFVQETELLKIHKQFCTHIAKRIKDATSLLWATSPLANRLC